MNGNGRLGFSILFAFSAIVCISSCGSPVAGKIPTVGNSIHAAPGSLPEFTAWPVWTKDVSGDPVDSNSSAMIDAVVNAGGFGFGGKFEIDFSMNVNHADASTPFQNIHPNPGFYTADSDLVPIPIPPGGAIEGSTDYACTTGDCRLLVVDDYNRKLYELWQADIGSSGLTATESAVWDLDKAYSPSGRGENCTAADVSGMPISPLLFTADEVASGHIDHAIRLTLPNARIRQGSYVHPATGVGAASGGSSFPPMGTRFRLRADFPLDTLPNDGARVVARALMKYGMILADGGQVPLTAESDRSTATTWSGLLGTYDLLSIRFSDFEVVDFSTPITATFTCVRN